MKKILAFFVLSSFCYGQSGTLSSSGLSIPRVSLVNTNQNINNNPIGTLIYNTNPATGTGIGLYCWVGTSWQKVSNSQNSSSVPQGSMVLSETQNDPNLVNNGFTMVGRAMTTFETFDANNLFPVWVGSTNTNETPASTYPTKKSHVSYWTGSDAGNKSNKMFVYGGTSEYPPFTYYLDIKFYNPSNNTWETVNATGTPPSGRYTQGSFITQDKRVFVWGGTHIDANWAIVYNNTGAIYNILNNSWSSITNVNAPSARASHTVVWTGSKMIVWGGQNSGGDLGDGAIYDPSNDSWTSINLQNAPSARRGHSAVWTGSKMIIWGGNFGGSGINSGTALNDGKMFDPNTNQWEDISSVSLLPRREHTAIWTGNEMIIWGGGMGGTPPWTVYNTGAKYNPTNNTWTMMTTENAPLPRRYFSSTWTGNYLIVFGGLDQNTYSVADCKAYDYVNNRWLSVETNTHAPSARSTHTSVWTGEKLIIWGGSLPDSGGLTTNQGSVLNFSNFQSPQNKYLYYYKKN